jgi:hypothetical protein
MELLYTICALVGGTLLGCQLLLALLGLQGHHEIGGHGFHDLGGHDSHGADGHEADHDAHVSWFAGILTFRTVVAALTFFGLAGRAASAAELQPASSLGLALAAGGGALLLVGWLMRSLYQLRADGTVRIQRAVGKCGTVYLPVPGSKAGVGKVQLNLQNRTMEYQAVTAQESLPTGAKITVVAVVGPDTVEVVPTPASEKISHV